MCQEGGVKKGGYLEDIEGSWLETWRTGSFLTSWMMFFYPMEDTLKISCWYFNYNCVRKWGSRRGGTWRKMRVPDWRYAWQGHSWHYEWYFFTLRKIPWTFRVDIPIGSVSGRGGVKKGGTWRTLRVPEQTHGGHSHSWRHEWCFFTPRKIPWKFCVDISIISVSGRGGQEGGTWRTLRVPDPWHVGQGHP